MVNAPNKEELAWAAGFVEADGCFSIRRKRNPVVSVGQSDKAPLLYLKKIFWGWGKIYKEARAGKTNKQGLTFTKDFYRWVVNGRQARVVTRLLFPFIVGRKRQLIIENSCLFGVNPAQTRL